MQQAGPTVFMPFPQDTDHFPAAKQWMINFRVTELDKAPLGPSRRRDSDHHEA
jgi:hypothetical protein